MESFEHVTPEVILKRNRSSSDVTVDTFRFIRSHFKNLLKTTVYIAGVPIILVTLITILGETSPDSMTSPLDIGALSIAGIVLQFLLTFIIFGIGAIYLKLVAREGQAPEDPVGSVLTEIKAHGLRLLALLILNTIAALVGMIFLVIPGVYLYTALFCSGFILIYDETPVTAAFSESLDLVKGFWWHTFLAMVLLFVVIYGISTIVSFPAVIFFFLLGYTEATGSAMPDGIWGTVLLTLTFVSSSLSYLVSIISGIGAGMLYFSLREKKEGSSILKEIADL
jgi:hypothetical protein